MSYQPSTRVLEHIRLNKINVIGITGEMMSGKDTVANFIRFAFCTVTSLKAFAYPLKQILMDHFGFTWDDVCTTEGKKRFNEFWGMTNREALQRVGTECFRNNFHPDTWLKSMELNIMKSNSKLFVISDVRFPNEEQMIHLLGGKVIKVWRTNIERNGSHMRHASETSINDLQIDASIGNNGTMVELFELVLNVLEEFDILDRVSINPALVGSAPDPSLEEAYFQALLNFTKNDYRLNREFHYRGV